MLYWVREIAGWALLAGSLYLIYRATELVNSRSVVEASVLVGASLIVMRCGMLLIRMATAARICERIESGRNAK